MLQGEKNKNLDKSSPNYLIGNLHFVCYRIYPHVQICIVHYLFQDAHNSSFCGINLIKNIHLII